MITKRYTLRPWLVVGALAAPLFAFSTAAQAQDDFTGTWQTNMGRMHIDQTDARASGEYEMKDGQVRGHVDGDVFDGVWAQSHSDHRCFEERMGSRYWGRFTLHLNCDGDGFRGRWSYCNDEPGSGGEWTGERHHHHDFPDHD